jgi:hypothetical protein
MATSIYSRYQGSDTVTVGDEPSLALRLQAPPDGSGGIVYTCVGGETLDLLAKRFYGNEALWWCIADANPRRFPLDWSSGDQIVVPPLTQVQRTTAK